MARKNLPGSSPPPGCPPPNSTATCPGAAGVVITLQTPAQAREVRTLMRRANVVPLGATVGPGSPLLRSIAGPPAKPIGPAPRQHSRWAAPGSGQEYAGHRARCKGRLLSKFAIVKAPAVLAVGAAPFAGIFVAAAGNPG